MFDWWIHASKNFQVGSGLGSFSAIVGCRLDVDSSSRHHANLTAFTLKERNGLGDKGVGISFQFVLSVDTVKMSVRGNKSWGISWWILSRLRHFFFFFLFPLFFWQEKELLERMRRGSPNCYVTCVCVDEEARYFCKVSRVGNHIRLCMYVLPAVRIKMSSWDWETWGCYCLLGCLAPYPGDALFRRLTTLGGDRCGPNPFKSTGISAQWHRRLLGSFSSGK